jgi:hypothetical protein
MEGSDRKYAPRRIVKVPQFVLDYGNVFTRSPVRIKEAAP